MVNKDIISLFLKEFHLERLIHDIFELVDEKKLQEFLKNTINENMSMCEVIHSLHRDCITEQIIEVLEDLEHDIPTFKCKCGRLTDSQEEVIEHIIENDLYETDFNNVDDDINYKCYYCKKEVE